MNATAPAPAITDEMLAMFRESLRAELTFCRAQHDDTAASLAAQAAYDEIQDHTARMLGGFLGDRVAHCTPLASPEDFAAIADDEDRARLLLARVLTTTF